MNVGDSVTWMQVTKSWKWALDFTEREGKIISIKGAVARVKLRNGRELEIRVGHLRKRGEKGHVTELFEKISSAPAGVKPNTPDAGASDSNNQGSQP